MRGGRFEEALGEVGGFGPFQLLLLALLVAPRGVLPCHFLLGNFAAAVPAHHCDPGPPHRGPYHLHNTGNLTGDQSWAVVLPQGPGGGPHPCQMFAPPQLQMLTNRTGPDLPTVGCQRGWLYDNSTFSSTIATEWDLVCEKKSLTKTTGTVFFFGVMMGALAFGYLCDKYGRRNTLLASYVLAVVFGFSSSFAGSYSQFAALRFCTGFGLAGISIDSIVLSIEWVDPAHRAFIGVIGSLAWSLGNMLLAGVAFLVRDWRTLVRVVTAPLGLALLTWWWVPESARWLLANGRSEEAQFYLDRCARFNRRPRLSRSKVETLSNMEVMENQDKNYSYLDLVRTPKMRRLTLLSGVVWYGVASTYYGISLNISGFGLNLFLTHFIYAAIEVPAKMAAFGLLDRWGRRKCQGGALLLTGVCVSINMAVPKDLWLVRAGVAILGKGLSEASFTIAFLYTTELFPTVIRQNALGYTSFMSRLGVSMAPLVLMLEDVWRLLPQMLIAAMATAAGMAALQLPETLDARLPETLADIEGSEPRGPAQNKEGNVVSPVDSSDVFLESKNITSE
ncbi:solute carrier family 22 member 7-like [Menidia menidia]